MAVTPVVLISTKRAEAAQTMQYTAPAGTRTLIDKFTATNTSGLAVTLTVNLVTSGSTAQSLNIISSAKSLAAGEVFTFPELVGHVLQPGDFISTLAGTVNSINIRASGREVT